MVFGVSISTAGELHVEIVPQFENAVLPFDKFSLTNKHGQVFSVTRLDFLLSDFALHRSAGDWIERTDWQAFVSIGGKRTRFDVENVPTGDYDKIRFHVGLRPEINHSKPEKYPPTHPLNPVLNGLHWGWAGGYVFFAIEGNWRTEGGELSGYSFHLGNDPLLMTVEIPVMLHLENKGSVKIALDLEQVFDKKFRENSSSTHSREKDTFATALKKKVETAFRVAPGEGDQVQAAFANQPQISGVLANRTSQITSHPYRFTFSAQFPMPDLPRDNPLTEEGVELGHRLFDEKLLSMNGTQSCASCHREENAFSDPEKKFSRGAEGQIGTRNTMPIFNLAWKNSFFWDGRALSLREQVLQPIQNPIEMHETLGRAVSKLSQTEFYPAEFRKVFGTPEITGDRIAKALEQFVITRVSCDSKFDRAMDGRAELTEEEKRGFQLFITEYDPRHEQFGADCFHCHGGPLFQSQAFANNGLDSEFKDVGRHNVTANESDKGRFAVPSLRNVELTAPYMHDGRFKTLEEVLEHYATGVKRSPTLDPNIAKHPDGGVPLSAADKKALVAFLKTLTEERLRRPSSVSTSSLQSASQ